MKKATFAMATLLAMLGCENGGAGRTLGITATGVVSGLVYFDANGDRALDAGDGLFPGARLRLLSPASSDTLARATTGPDGSFRFSDVPVGSYALVIDSASAGDSARVVERDPLFVSVLPGDSVRFVMAISFPTRSIAEARALAPGTRLFVQAIAMHARATFTDTTLHVVDASGSMRATRVRPSAVAAGDSVILRARIGERAGQRVLDDVTVFVVGPTLLPAAPTLTTAAAAAGGAAGSLDAAFVRVLDALVTDTATVSGNRELTVTDGSGSLIVVLDRAADSGFRPPLPLGLYVPNARFDVSGILVPTGTGAWRLKPRNALDLTLR